VQTSFIKFATFDCSDALVVAGFWAAALGGEVDEESTPDKAFMEAPGWGGPSATTLHDRAHLVVMQDPEGNEFCVERGPGDQG